MHSEYVASLGIERQKKLEKCLGNFDPKASV